MKTACYVIFATIFLSFKIDAEASSFTVTNLPDITNLGASSIQSSGLRGHGTLNDELLIFVKHDDYGNKKIIAYNLKTFVSQTIHVEPTKSSFLDVSIYDQVLSDGTIAYIILDGNLYVSDGTNSGTHLVKRLGVYNNKEGILNSLLDGQVINQKLYFTYAEDIGVFPIFGEAPTNVNLWRTDGTAGSIARLPESGVANARHTFVKRINGYESVFFFKGEHDLWRTTSHNTSVKVGDLGVNQNLPSAFDPIKVVDNTRGSYFCTREPDTTINGGVLWRVSNAGTLTALASDCKVDSLIEFKDTIYFKSAAGLMSTNGVVGDSQLIVSGIDNNTSTPSSVHSCVANDNLYVSMMTANEALLLEVFDDGQYRRVIQQKNSAANRAGISRCFTDKLIFVTGFDSDSQSFELLGHWLIDAIADSTAVINAPMTGNVDYNSSYNNLRPGISSRAEQYCVPLFCLIDSSAFSIPATLELLFSEEET